MKKICAWCGKSLQPASEEAGTFFAVSHGVCEECVQTFFLEKSYALRPFLDSINEPVIVVEKNHRVRCANVHAEALLGRQIKSEQMVKFGDIVECENAHLPGGCGRTVHCSGCTIRFCIAETARNGKKHQRVPATIKSDNRENPDISFFVSTEKTQDYIVLRLEKA